MLINAHARAARSGVNFVMGIILYYKKIIIQNTNIYLRLFNLSDEWSGVIKLEGGGCIKTWLLISL